MARPKKQTNEATLELEDGGPQTSIEVLVEEPELTDNCDQCQDAIPLLSKDEKEQLGKLSEFLQRVYLHSNNVPERTAIQSWRMLLATLAEK